MPATAATAADNNATINVSPLILSRNGVTVRGTNNNHYFIVDPDMPQEAFDTLCEKWKVLLNGNRRINTAQTMSLWHDYYHAIRADYRWSHEYADRYGLTTEERNAHKARFAAKVSAFLAIMEFVTKGELD